MKKLIPFLIILTSCAAILPEMEEVATEAVVQEAEIVIKEVEKNIHEKN